MWSTTEPAAALICCCLPVLRPLYTRGLKKLGPSHAWSSYISRRAKTNELPTGSFDKDSAIMTGKTWRSPTPAQAKKGKPWSKTADTEMSGTYEEMFTPLHTLNKPLPPAYSPRQEEEEKISHHTWSLNLLSRSKDERKSPKLTMPPTVRDSVAPWRSPTSPETGVRTTVTSGKWGDKVAPIRLKTQKSTSKKSSSQQSQLDNWTSPSWTAKTSISQTISLVPNPRGPTTPVISPSTSMPIRHVVTADERHPSTPRSPEGGFILPPKPQPRIESEGTVPPRSILRTANRSVPPPDFDPAFSSPTVYNDRNQVLRESIDSPRGERTFYDDGRPVSEMSTEPSVEMDVTQGDIEAVIPRRQHM